jgi:hypothetical protein
MATNVRLTRHKISTTIASQSADYLQSLIARGDAATFAEAVDLAIERLLAYENRERLAEDTAAYFSQMTEEEAAEERRLGAALAQSAAGLDFDR